MTVLDVLKVMDADDKVKIYYGLVPSCKMTVEEARELPNLDTLPVCGIWYNNMFEYMVIDTEVA